MRTYLKKLAMLLLCFSLTVSMFAAVGMSAKAVSGNVYTCTINRCYRHPVSGVIEDSGGEGSYATGQGMVEGCVYDTGIMEVTADGHYYLTIRMSLMDYTSGHTFWVQNVGDSAWSSPAAGIVGYGSDTNGTTADICIEVPNESCVLRGSMYVEPMGRDVVWYMYPSNYNAGNSTDMTPSFITADAADNGGAASNNGAASGGVSGGTSAGSGTVSAGNSTLPSNNKASGSTEGGIPSAEGAPELQTKLTDPVNENPAPDTDSSLSSAQGLSLSTAENETAAAAAPGGVGSQILVNVLSILISGCILMAVAAGLIIYIRKNWYRWGGGLDDDEE